MSLFLEVPLNMLIQIFLRILIEEFSAERLYKDIILYFYKDTALSLPPFSATLSWQSVWLLILTLRVVREGHGATCRGGASQTPNKSTSICGL